MSKDKNKLIPELRFPEFVNEGEWDDKKLDELGETISGLSGKSGGDFGTGKPFVTYKQVFDSAYIDFSKCGRVNVKENEYQNILQKGDILFTTSSETPNEVGFASVLLDPPKEPTYLNSFCFSLRPVNLDNLKPEFSRYLFHSPIYRKSIGILAQGSTRYNISKGAFLNLKLPIPRQKEQQKIASCLSSLDEVITAHSQKLDALKDHKKSLMQNLFPQEGETVPKYRFPKFVNDGEWEKKIIGDVTNVSTGGTPDSTNHEYWHGEIPWMNSGELNNKRIYSVSNYITLKGLKESSTKLIPPNCVLIGLAGQGKTRGTAAINYIELCTNQSIGSIHPNENIFNSEFLYQRMDLMYEQLRYLSAGEGGRGGLNLHIIKSIELFFPKIKEQQKIADCLSSLDASITSQAEKIVQLKQHKKGLMQGLFPKINE